MPDGPQLMMMITATKANADVRNYNLLPVQVGCNTTWMKTIQQDLRSNNLSLDEAITVAQNRPLWRLMSAFGATHP